MSFASGDFRGGVGKVYGKTIGLEDNPWPQERIMAAFVAYGGLGAMPRIDYSIIRKDHQLVTDAVEQLGSACPGEIEPTNALTKKGVTSEYYFISQKRDSSRAVPRSVQYAEGKTVYRYVISLLEQYFRLRHGGHRHGEEGRKQAATAR